MTGNYELIFMIGGLFLSLCAFSLIFGDNYLFRLGTAILSGAVSAYICVLIAENYFYPLILDLVSGKETLTTAQLIRAAAVVIGILLLFSRAYMNGKTGGKVILTVLLAVSAAVMVYGAAGGTIPAFVRMLAAQFHRSTLSKEQSGDVWYWINAGTVLVSAIGALLYTRHYDLGSRKSDGRNGSLLGDILIGFTFGAVAAAVFLTAANILVNHISGLIGSVQSLLK